MRWHADAICLNNDVVIFTTHTFLSAIPIIIVTAHFSVPPYCEEVGHKCRDFSAAPVDMKCVPLDYCT